MKSIKAAILMLIFASISCKTNQTHHKLKCGKWVYQDTVNGVPIKSFGKYRKDIEKKTWVYYENNQLVKKEKYKHGICYVTTYFENGAIASQGKTKLVTSSNDTHWYYFDTWEFYDQTGKLIQKKQYENGALLSETVIK
jgi:antitoxin component YwqK of YwqJK toxin-antitoxin module